MEETISGIKDISEYFIIQKKLNLKSPCTKHLGNLEHHEKTISTNNRNRGRRKNIGKRHRKYFQSNHRGKFH